MPRIIEAAEAEAFFASPCQRWASLLGDKSLPVMGVEYWADGPVCAVFHDAHWPMVIAGHFAVKPEGRGQSDGPALAILQAAWAHYQPQRITGWMKKSNRPGIAFVRRLGFQIDGEMPLADPVVMLGWCGKCQ